MDLKKRLKDALYIGLGLFLIGILMLRADVTDTLDVMSGMDLRLLFLVLGLYFLNTFCKVIRWFGLLKGMGAERIGPILLPIFLSSLALNNSTPGKIGGEPVRAYMLKEHTGNRGTLGLASIFAEKSLDILAILALAVSGIIFLVITLGFDDVKGLVYATAVGGVVMVLLIFIMMNRRSHGIMIRWVHRTALILTKGRKDGRIHRIAGKIEERSNMFNDSLANIRKHKITGAGILIMTSAIWLNESLRFFIILNALPGNIDISFQASIAAVSLANILGFILPMGSGNILGGASVIEMLTGDGTSATAASITQVITSLWISIPIGVISLYYLKRRSRR
ncbi:MAG: lysylphosphatidylglycerol synthase transmembrane domain-containing protein [Candidatus Thermoplasmatota archaeon]|nr:lysylphosphatidylglycerol synthase transmembrane domain-containing protein [Candidatus Thermoplasmatota archaeon]